VTSAPQALSALMNSRNPIDFDRKYVIGSIIKATRVAGSPHNHREAEKPATKARNWLLNICHWSENVENFAYAAYYTLKPGSYAVCYMLYSSVLCTISQLQQEMADNGIKRPSRRGTTIRTNERNVMKRAMDELRAALSLVLQPQPLSHLLGY